MGEERGGKRVGFIVCLVSGVRRSGFLSFRGGENYDPRIPRDMIFFFFFLLSWPRGLD